MTIKYCNKCWVIGTTREANVVVKGILNLCNEHHKIYLEYEYEEKEKNDRQ